MRSRIVGVDGSASAAAALAWATSEARLRPVIVTHADRQQRADDAQLGLTATTNGSVT